MLYIRAKFHEIGPCNELTNTLTNKRARSQYLLTEAGQLLLQYLDAVGWVF